MKAKDLIAILEKNPEAEVGFEEYVGCDTPFLTVKQVKFISKGDQTKSTILDGGELIDKSGEATDNFFLLRSREY